MTHKKAWEMEECPLFVCEACVYADIKLLLKIIGYSYTSDRYISKEQRTARHISIEDIKKINSIGCEKYKNNIFVKNVLLGSKKVSSELANFSKKLKKEDYSKKSNKELLDMYLDFYNKFAWVVAYYHALRPEAIKLLEDMIRRHIVSCSDKAKEKILSALLSRKYSKEEIITRFNLKNIPKDVFEISNTIYRLGKRRYNMHKVWANALKNKKPLFEEIGNRLGLSCIEVENCLKKEIEQALVPLNRQPIKKRIKQFQYQIEHGKGVLYDKISYREEKTNREKEIRGVCAHPGIVKGVVKVIRTNLINTAKEDIEKMEKGSILVTGNTSPDMIIAINKALAIVTDEGGMLSHAAIISRELGIPCIVGTGRATQVLKDGDYIEVNAEEGIVRKLSKVNR